MAVKKRKIEGIPMYLDPSDNGISQGLINKGCRERAFIWIMKRSASGIAFDIGANIGYNTLKLCRLCDSVYAFEPDNRSLKLLKENIHLNGFNDRAQVFDCALSDNVGETAFHMAKTPNTSSICVKGKKMVTVKTTTLDVFCSDNNVYPDFVKMDIEGAEVNVLNGAKTVLQKASPNLLIEVHPQYYSCDNDFGKCLRDLLELGYRFKYVVNAKGGTKEIRKYPEVRKFSNFYRSVFSDVPQDKVVEWASVLPANGKKNIRAIYVEREKDGA